MISTAYIVVFLTERGGLHTSQALLMTFILWDRIQ